MGTAWLASLGKFLAPAAKWIGLNVIVPMLTAWAKKIAAKVKANREYKKEADANVKRNEEYEKHPSDDSFGDSA